MKVPNVTTSIALLTTCVLAAGMPQWPGVPAAGMYSVEDRSHGQAPSLPMRDDRRTNVQRWLSLHSQVMQQPTTARSARVDAVTGGQRLAIDLNALPPDDLESEEGTSTITSPMVHLQSPKSSKGERKKALPRTWEKFSMQSYPLDTPALRHLYDDQGLVPVDFEKFVTKNRFMTDGMLYRPEPKVLEAIRQKIENQLNAIPSQLSRVSSNYHLMDGEYLWPPLRANHKKAGRLDFPARYLTLRFRKTITNRLPAHSMERPNLFRLEVPVDGNMRHILMVPVQPGRYARFYGPVSSDLWLFMEAVKARSEFGPEYKNRLTFLGAMFLPKKIQEPFLAIGAFKPAFSELK